ncbi:transmembrane protein 272 [Mastacembelus armatus]|uniref:Transmembrane protein 272-like n=1 Tax=Mastacembelus armatus TaxID=205130 RepID=A0A7N8X9W4_9TELE|nr:transmembrane protein 272-like [Mastacembelus armatus]
MFLYFSSSLWTNLNQLRAPPWACASSGGGGLVSHKSRQQTEARSVLIHAEIRVCTSDIMSSNGLIQRISNPPQPPAPILGCSKIFMCIMPIAHIAIGAVYLKECPRQHYIPIYLIVVGVFALVLNVLSCLPCAQEPKDGTSNPLSRVCAAWNSLTSFFLFCWFIAGNVWIYSIYQPNYTKNATNVDAYCHKTLYLFAFWATTLVYILLGVLLLTGCCALLCFFLCGRADPDDNV